MFMEQAFTGSGTYEFSNAEVTYSASTCGNLAVDPGEECDDGNTIDTDGCTNECRFCDDGGILCGGVCVDKRNDPNNCGRCGNRCTFGTCRWGSC